MATETVLAFGFGGMFVVLLFVTAVWLIGRPSQPIPSVAAWLLRVITALAGAGVAAILSGMLTVDLHLPIIAIRATSGLAVFVLIYLVNPPQQGAEHTRPRRVTQRQNVASSGTGTQIAGDSNRVER